MLFRNCFCTNSVCGPSRAVVLTGKYSHKNGFYRNGDTFNGQQQTMPKLLQAAGYQTALVGKWHLESAPTGFDYHQILIGQGPYFDPPMIENGAKVQRQGYTTDIITDVALDFLRNKRDAGKPFLLMYQHKAPHREWQSDDKHAALFRNEDIPEPPNLFDDYEGRGTAAKTQEMQVGRDLTELDLKLVPPNGLTDEQLASWNARHQPELARQELAACKTEAARTRWKYQRYMKEYLRCVAAVDDNIGRVLDYLDESGLSNNTILIYSSDQGFYLGEHGWFDKRFMYEESLRQPLLVRWPGKVKPGSINTDLVSNLDFAETLLDAAGVRIPRDMQGRSLVPLLKGERPADWRGSHFYQYYEYPAVHMVRRHYGVRTDRYKLIYYYGINEWELYDLEQDPHEMHSVYGEAAYADVVQKLKTELDRLRAHYNVPDDKEPERKKPAA
jgi:arylsulfatase A-like enzyme